jgi:hypothetical protein
MKIEESARSTAQYRIQAPAARKPRRQSILTLPSPMFESPHRKRWEFARIPDNAGC